MGERLRRVPYWIKVAVGALVLFVGEAVLSIRYRADHPWLPSAMFMSMMAVGIFVGARQKRGRRWKPDVRMAEVSTAEMVELQEIALARGFHGIDSVPIGPYLSPTRKHFLLVRSARLHRKSGILVLRCFVYLAIDDLTTRLGMIEMEQSVFDRLTQVEDRGQAVAIVQQHAGARVYGIRDRQRG